MKKLRLYLLLFSILLATLACNLPFNQPEEEPIEDSLETPFADSDQALTLAPTPTSSPSKKEFLAGGFSILLPASYEVSDDPANSPIVHSFIGVIGEWLGDSFEDVSAFTEQNIAILGYDTEDTNNPPTSFLIVQNEQFSGLPLGLIKVLVENMLSDMVDLQESDTLKIDGRTVTRWITSLNYEGRQTSQVSYLFKESGKLWVVAFITDPSLLDGQIVIFDGAIESLTLPETD